MTTAQNYQSINQTFNELRTLLVEKLSTCYVEKSAEDSFTELIEAVGDIKANETINENNIRPKNMPIINTTDVSSFNTSLYKRIRYYMKLLGYFLVLKGIPLQTVNQQTDLKGLIELIDDIDVIIPTILTLGAVDEIQYYGTNVAIPYTLTDINGGTVAGGDITIQDSNGVVYDSIGVGDELLLTPLHISDKINDEYQAETFIVTYNGSYDFLPSEPQTFSVIFLPAKIRLSLTMINTDIKSRYHNSHTTGYEADNWEIKIKTVDYQNQPLANIPFSLMIPDVFYLADVQTDEQGNYIFNQVFDQPGNHTITCVTNYEEIDKLSNTEIEYDIQIKHNILKQTQNSYTDYAGKNQYTYSIDIIDEDTGAPTSAYDGHTIKLFFDEEQIGSTNVDGNTASYTFTSFSSGERILKWVLEESNFFAETHTYINILSNFTLPQQKTFFLNNFPEFFYRPLGQSDINTISGTVEYVNIDNATSQDNITLTTDEYGKITIPDYINSNLYKITLHSSNDLNEVVTFEYEIKPPFVINEIYYNRKMGVTYNIIFYDTQNEYQISLIKDNEKIDSSLYIQEIEDTNDEENIQTNNNLEFSITATDDTAGLYTLSINMSNYTNSIDFKLSGKNFTLLTSSVTIGENTIEIACNDDNIDTIYIDSDDIDIIDIEKNEDIFIVTGIFTKAGVINFDVIDTDASTESFSIEVEPIDIEDTVNVYLYIDDNLIEDERTTDTNISYIDEDKVKIIFNVDTILYSDISVTYSIMDNDMHTQSVESFIYDNDSSDIELSIENLLPGNYTACFYLDNSDYYYSFIKEINFTILKAIPQLQLNMYSAYDDSIYDPSENHQTILSSDISTDLLFKKGNYVNTYLIIESSGKPNNALLTLVDESNNILYSPYDANRNEIKTQCNIINGVTNIISLPADYTDDTWFDLEADIYNWKLLYTGSDVYESIEIPVDIEVRDFSTWSCNDIFPNEYLVVNLRSYIDIYIDTVTLYDVDKIVGEHSYNLNGQLINYTVKNPIKFIGESIQDFGCMNIGYEALSGYANEVLNININDNDIDMDSLGSFFMSHSFTTPCIQSDCLRQYPPGIYNCSITANTTTCPEEYIATGVIEVSTNKCSINLSFDEALNSLVATYLYNNTTPIPNATIQISSIDDTVAQITTTDSNGQVYIQVPNGMYYAEVLDNYTGEVLLTSNFAGNEFSFNNESVIGMINEDNVLTNIDALSQVTYHESIGDLYSEEIDIEEDSSLGDWKLLFLF